MYYMYIVVLAFCGILVINAKFGDRKNRREMFMIVKPNDISRLE